jgi:hypothetical protein
VARAQHVWTLRNGLPPHPAELNTAAIWHDQRLPFVEDAQMPGPAPSPLNAVSQVWSDLVATIRSHPLPSVVAMIACAVISLVNPYVNPPHDDSALAVARALGLAVAEAFAVTPMLLAAHRFIILGETQQSYAAALLTTRFWRFFLLSAALAALLFVPILLARSLFDDDVLRWAFVLAIVAFLASSSLLSLLFPAIAVDAPGAGVRRAVADLWGNAWRIFWVGTFALLPLVLLTVVAGIAQNIVSASVGAWPAQFAFALPEGAFQAATYTLLVLIASRFYLALADRLARAG